VADEAGLGFLTVKRLLNHTFQGGVTGGYIFPASIPKNGGVITFTWVQQFHDLQVSFPA